MASRMNGMKLLCASITVAAAGWWPWADDRAVPPLLPLWTLPDLSLSEW